MKRELKIFAAGVVLTLAYVTVATALNWHGWLIAVVGIALGAIYTLIAAPLSLGPAAPLREHEDQTEFDPDPLPLPGVASAAGMRISVPNFSGRTWRSHPGRAARVHR
jgi:hypothetical protein